LAELSPGRGVGSRPKAARVKTRETAR
jgi:hypothetical protein